MLKAYIVPTSYSILVQESGVVTALRGVLLKRLDELKRGLSNWYTAHSRLTSDLADIAGMFRCYEVTETFALLSFLRILLEKHFENIVVEEALGRINSPEYALPEPFKSMFEREVHRLDMDHFDEDLIPKLSKLGEGLTSVHLLTEASKAHGTAYEYQLLKLLLDSSKPAVEELNGLYKGFLEESLERLEKSPDPGVFRDAARDFTREVHRKAYGWP